jgi:hypothetical protein
MRRALLFSLGMVCSSHAFLGDWKIWSSAQTARMAVLRSDGTVLAATTGGVEEWDPTANKGTMYSGLQGIPSLDVASLVANSGDSIWAICTDGHIAVLPPGDFSWEPMGTYPSSGWTFSPGAATFWKGYLVLGGPQGLSLLRVSDTDAVDNISTFGAYRDTVLAVMAQNDTLWVALPEGLAYATDPVWNTDSASTHIGRAGYYLSADRWTVLPSPTRGDYTLLRDSTGVHLGTLGQQWSDYANGLSINGSTFSWKGGSATVPGAVQAISTPKGYFLSTSSMGLVQLQNGTLTALHPDGTLPDNLPFSVAAGPGPTFYHLTGDGSSTRVWRLPSGASKWISDTIKVPSPDNAGTVIRPYWDLSTTFSYGVWRKVFAVGPQGETVVGSWGDNTSHGGYLISPAPGTWSLWNRHDDTCFIEFDHSDYPLYGVVTLGVHAATSGVWASTLFPTGAGPLIYFPSVGNKTPVCVDLDPTSIVGSGGALRVNDLDQVGTDLWLATSSGLVQLQNVAPSNPPQTVSGAQHWPANVSAPPLFTRLSTYPLGGRTWIVAAGSGELGIFPADPSSTDTIVRAPGANQNYTALAVDAQGQIWAAGGSGIDIYSLQMDSTTPVFQLLHSVTTRDGLPDDAIRDLALDSASGRAVIATASGLSIWTSPYRPVPVRLSKSTIKVYPNPVRLRQNQTLFVDGATANANFDLVAADGTLVLHVDHSKSTDGLFQIQLPATSKLRPGVYYWSLKDSRNSAHGPLLVGE